MLFYFINSPHGIEPVLFRTVEAATLEVERLRQFCAYVDVNIQILSVPAGALLVRGTYVQEFLP